MWQAALDSMDVSQIPGSADFVAALNRICQAEKGLGRVIDAPFGLPGVIENGTYYMARKRSEYLDGRHFTERVGDVVAFKKDGKFADAESLLLRICDVVEKETAFMPPWYYEQLAIIYSKQKRYGEAIGICERYERCNAGRGGQAKSRLALRLEKLRAKHANRP